MLADPSEMETDPERTKYVEEFNISENTYNLVKDFYEDQKASRVYGLLETDLLRYLFVNALDRKELEGITEEDVDRALKVVDGDNDLHSSLNPNKESVMLICQTSRRWISSIEMFL